jgi:hypothetical protein
MRPEIYSADAITNLLRKQTIATMPQLMRALGTSVERTVFRKLSGLAYRSSYSHRGRYYTIDELAQFDAMGLWSFRSARFSAHGNLVDTASALVKASRAGYFVDELDKVLQVTTKDCLRHLTQQGRLTRSDVQGRHLYYSADPTRGRVQLVARQALVGPSAAAATLPVTHELKATIILFLGLLDEKQRRLFAGLESLKVGPGGDVLVAEMLGLDPATVAKGRHELALNDLEPERLRRPGAGRKAVEKNARDHLAHPGAADAGDRRRPDDRAQMDAQDDGQGCCSTPTDRDLGRSENGLEAAQEAQVPPARQREEDPALLTC